MDSSNSKRISDTEVSFSSKRIVFVCGANGKEFYNSAMKAVTMDLIRDFYVSRNNDGEEDIKITQKRLSNAELMIFFADDETVRNKNCLLTLQYAWYLMIPILMIRKPRTKLVLKNKLRKTIYRMGLVGKNFIARWEAEKLTKKESIDYGLVQDVLLQGYKLSEVYYENDHRNSMAKIKERILSVLKPMLHEIEHEDSKLCLSPDDWNMDDTTESERTVINTLESKKNEMAKEMEQKKEFRSGSLNIHEGRTLHNKLNPLLENNPFYRGDSSNTADYTGKSIEETTDEAAKTEPMTKIDEEGSEEPKLSRLIKKHVTQGSRESSIERRMSLSSLDDKKYKKTQYMVFSVRDPSKKPRLVKFPEELDDPEMNTELSVWGSDTSLEKEVELAELLNGHLISDDDDDDDYAFSYETSPAPYISPI